jgi:uncharacterized protein (TIGR02145 family)
MYITTYPLIQRINTMRKLLLTTAAVAAAIGLAGCSKTPTPKSVSAMPDTLAVAIDTQTVTHDTVAVAVDTLPIKYDTLTDTRDGQTYKTVKIGQQAWMAQNLNYKPKSWSSCYDDNETNCKKYGRLYDWETAKIVCPVGWKLPDTSDWEKLVTAVGGKETMGKKLKATNGWNDDEDGENGNGTNDYGFSALPGGYRDPLGDFDHGGDEGYWWLASELDNGYAFIGFADYIIGVYGVMASRELGLSVRCVAKSP